MGGAERELEGRVALVTGGGTGLGRACALELARRGAAVAVNYARSADAAKSTADEIRAGGGRAVAVQADVADPAAVDAMAAEVERSLGPSDLLVANAGITEYVPFEQLDRLDVDLWERILGVNVVGTFLSVQSVVAGMRERGFGRIVLISSNSAFGASGSSIPYAVSKGAIVTLAHCLARALAPDVLVNAVAPGWMQTPWVDKYLPAELAAELRSDTTAAVDVDDVARLVASVLSSDSLTGQAIVADRGESVL
jgi:3-oxoacyl-[acyl-carrier protein] reductase